MEKEEDFISKIIGIGIFFISIYLLFAVSSHFSSVGYNLDISAPNSYNIKELENGSIRIDMDTEMYTGETYIIDVYVKKGRMPFLKKSTLVDDRKLDTIQMSSSLTRVSNSTTLLTPNLTYSDIPIKHRTKNVYSDTIQITSFVDIDVASSDGSALEITPITDGFQLIDSMNKSQWKWSVKPIQSGTYSIYFTAKSKIETEFGQVDKVLEVYNKKMDISVNITYTVKRFFTNNWEWLVTVILIPLIPYLLKRIKEFKTEIGE